jgi:hypothetical protein
VRIVLALERSPASAAVVEPALALAQSLHATLCTLFVEDPGLLGYAALPFAREVDPESGEARPLNAARLERALQDEAARTERLLAEAARRRTVEISFRVVRGRIDVAARSEADAGDIVMIGVFSGRGRWSSPEPAGAAGRLVAAYYDSAATSSRVLDTAARLSMAVRHELAIAAPAGAQLTIDALPPGHRKGARLVRLGDGGVPAFLQAVARFPISTYVVPEALAVQMRRTQRGLRGAGDYLLVPVR